MATCIYCALYDSKPVLSKNGRVMRNRGDNAGLAIGPADRVNTGGLPCG